MELTKREQFTKEQLIAYAVKTKGVLERRIAGIAPDPWTDSAKQSLILVEIALAALTTDVKWEPLFYVCGVTDDGTDCLCVSDDEAHFWTVYRQNSDGTSIALVDFHTRERAEATMAILTRVGGVE